MSVRLTMFCDVEGGCYLEERGTDPGNPRWIHVGDKDYCWFHGLRMRDTP